MRHRIICALAAVLGLAGVAAAQQTGALRPLTSVDDSRGWEGVGRIDLGGRGFCTGALIEPDLVLTAAHCLFDKATGARFRADEITFLAGLRNGRAAAYRGVRRAVAHPDYVFSRGGGGQIARMAHDLALLELDQPIRLPSILPFGTAGRAAVGASVGVVSYAHDRAEAPSLQEVCGVLAREGDVFVLSCRVDFGSSGAPVFTMEAGRPQIVSVVSAKAGMNRRDVALGTALDAGLSTLRATMTRGDGVFHRPAPEVRRLSGSEAREGIGAKFVRP